ncbi:hypothetical protein ABDK00_008445 [Niabella insulamsoli]|uniref:hypothetical protein n=1 Tax=Niabella insulamsoli TaxID=3144874 RepID=UPI0031FE33DD
MKYHKLSIALLSIYFLWWIFWLGSFYRPTPVPEGRCDFSPLFFLGGTILFAAVASAGFIIKYWQTRENAYLVFLSLAALPALILYFTF